jgi:hypothetical protein
MKKDLAILIRTMGLLFILKLHTQHPPSGDMLMRGFSFMEPNKITRKV